MLGRLTAPEWSLSTYFKSILRSRHSVVKIGNTLFTIKFHRHLVRTVSAIDRVERLCRKPCNYPPRSPHVIDPNQWRSEWRAGGLAPQLRRMIFPETSTDFWACHWMQSLFQACFNHWKMLSKMRRLF